MTRALLDADLTGPECRKSTAPVGVTTAVRRHAQLRGLQEGAMADVIFKVDFHISDLFSESGY